MLIFTRRLRCRFVLSTLACAILSLAASAANQGNDSTLVFMHVNVVPMNRETVLERQMVLVRNGRIAAIGPGDTVDIPPNARRIEAAGRYLIPGLTDAHVHLFVPD